MIWLERLLQDFRFGLRVLRKERAFALLAVMALALGIGATTIIFSVIDNVLLEPFPYREAERLTKFYIHDPAHPDQTGRADYLLAEYRAFKEQTHVFDDVIATSGVDVLYSSGEGAKLFRGYETTINTFDFFGVAPQLGRTFVADDGRPDAAPVAVISYRAWQSEFAGDRGVIGRVVTLNQRPTTIIGVMPPRFILYDGDFWLPLTVERPEMRVATMGRLKHGSSVRAAAGDLAVTAHELAKIYPELYPSNFNVSTVSLIDRVVRRFRPLLYALMMAVGMLLLIACSNVANLLLARATAREHEIAVRASLGATRVRLIVQLMVESLLLALVGCAAGTALAYGGIHGISAALPRDLIPNEAVIRLNGRVLLFGLGLAVISTLLCGLAPSLHAIGYNLYGRVQRAGKGSGADARHGRLRAGFVVAQVALSLVLLVGAGLTLRSLLALEAVDLGFTPDHLLAARIPFPQNRYRTAEEKHAFFRSLLQRVSTLPGVTTAAEISSLPPYGGPRSDVTILGQANDSKRRASLQLCSEDAFRALGVRLLRGQLLTEADVESARRVVVVNETLARNFFGEADALGRSLKFDAFDRAPESPRDAYFEIVGIVSDTRNNGLQQRPQPEVYLPYTITGVAGRGVLVRTAVEPAAMLTAVQRAIWSVDPNVAAPLPEAVETMLQRDSYAQPRFALLVLGLFAVIGLVLSAIGIFSVMAYTVTLRTREIGIRMALGAQRSTVMKAVLRGGLAMIVCGIVLGELASFALTRLLQNQLWGVSSRDPVTLFGVVAVFLLVGTASCLIPARRATRVDPVIALRYE